MLKGKKVIAVSNFIANHITTIYPNAIESSDIVTIPRGVDEDHFSLESIGPNRRLQMAESLHLEHNCPVILLPGRFTEWKGHLQLIEALKKMNNDDYLCLMVGSYHGHESYHKRVKNAIRTNGLESHVRILPPSSDMPALYAFSDVVICPSTRPEAFGRIPIEAQAMGRPVIAFNHGGASETIIDTKTGWLVPPGDNEALAASIEKALKMTERTRKNFATRARESVIERFSLSAMRNLTLSLYADVINDTASPGAEATDDKDDKETV